MRRLVMLIAAVALTLGVPAAASADTTRYFSDADPINLGVSANAPQQYSNSATLAAKFGSSSYDANMAYGNEAPAIYQATYNTPTYTITPRQSGWGNPFQGERMPWDPSWTAPVHVDGWAVIISADKSKAIECWETKVTNGVPSCQFGAVSNPSASSLALKGGATGSGISRLAGVITQEDWDTGIDHALVFGTPDNGSGYVYPANKTDGGGSGVMHEGDYIWMDPSCHPSGLTPAQQRVFDALQTYGAFNVDNAATFGFASEYHATPPGISGAGGYTSMRALPWASCLHVGKATKGGTPAPTTVSPTPSETPTTASPTPTEPSPTPTEAKLSAGNICRASVSDKRNWWAVSNVGDTAVSYTSYVQYKTTRTTGPSGTIQPDQVVSLRTANGGGLHVVYGDAEARATSNSSIHCS